MVFCIYLFIYFLFFVGSGGVGVRGCVGVGGGFFFRVLAEDCLAAPEMPEVARVRSAVCSTD
jgi:hypothetical protein